jgi:hypothetical protein
MESKKQRFAKGSEEAKEYMAGLRAKRGNKGGSGTNPPPPPPPANCDCVPTTTEKPKRRNNKNIVVDF